MEVSVLHRIHYSNKNLMSAEDIGKAILAFSEIAKSAGPLAGLLIDGLSVTNIEITLDDIATGSLSEVFKLKIYTKFQENITKRLQELAGQRGWKALEEYAEDVPKIITMLFVAALVLAATEKAKVMFAGDKPTYIINLYNVEVNKLADCLDRPVNEVDQCIRSYAEKNFKRLGKHSLNMITPAKREDGASMISSPLPPSAMNTTTLDSKTLKEIPFPWEIRLDDDDFTETHDNLYVKIIGKRLTSNKRGWRAIVPALGEEEIALTLSVAVSPGDLWKKDEIYGRGIVVYRHLRDGTLAPIELHLLELNAQPDSAKTEQLDQSPFPPGEPIPSHSVDLSAPPQKMMPLAEIHKAPRAIDLDP